MLAKLQSLILDPYAVRTIARGVIRSLRLGDYPWRVELGAVERPHYAYCLYHAAVLAKRLGLRRISAIEFGVAGGNGLVNLEAHAAEVTRALGVEIDIYGFDTGEGLPEPVDHRDLPYHWKKGFYKMDVPRITARLHKAKLVLGEVKDTSVDFFHMFDPAPIGAIFYDLDFHSSTRDALAMLVANEKYHLPRVFTYFDDTVGTEMELYSDDIGQRLAIREFNQAHDEIRLGLPYHLLGRRIVESWYHQIFIAHFFRHSLYNTFVSDEDQQLPVR